MSDGHLWWTAADDLAAIGAADEVDPIPEARTIIPTDDTP